MIKPQRQMNARLILSEEDNIQHTLASLLMGETKQSNIVSKLSSKQFASRTKQALWEMNAILMTDHLLNSIGDVGFRQSIQAALNRGEAYNQLRRHVEKVNGRHFRGITQSEVVVWNECARLLTNCVIYYNAVLLSRLLQKAEQNGNTELCEFIKRLSPVAWTHINFQGRYELLFPLKGGAIDIDAILIHLENIKFNDSQWIIA